MMTTLADDTTTHATTAQGLIDARLDMIDRMLLGRLPWRDRASIVREVESQIHEHLREAGSDEDDCDAVLAALARLDPPEAFLLGEGGPSPMASFRAPAPAARQIRQLPPTPSVRSTNPKVGFASGLLGLASFAGCLLAIAVFFVAELGDGEAFLYLGEPIVIGLSFIAASVGIILAGVARLRGGWAVTGLVLGIVSAVILLVEAVAIVALVVG